MATIMATLGLLLFGKAATASEHFLQAMGMAKLPGKPAQDFTLPDLDGNQVSLHDYRGKLIFLNFWATWCIPCREEMPAMEQLHRTFQPQGLAILAGLALLAPLAGSLGIGVSSVVSFLFVLACPLSMLVMMYFMMRGQKAERQDQGQTEGQPLPQMTPAETAVAMAEGDGQLDGREAFPIPGEIQPSPVLERATVKRQRPRR
jgi:thiol-disulfide isomerase/thioredoxin